MMLGCGLLQFLPDPLFLFPAQGAAAPHLGGWIELVRIAVGSGHRKVLLRVLALWVVAPAVLTTVTPEVWGKDDRLVYFHFKMSFLKIRTTMRTVIRIASMDMRYGLKVRKNW